jgi:hypothetical protein
MYGAMGSVTQNGYHYYQVAWAYTRKVLFPSDRQIYHPLRILHLLHEDLIRNQRFRQLNIAERDQVIDSNPIGRGPTLAIATRVGEWIQESHKISLTVSGHSSSSGRNLNPHAGLETIHTIRDTFDFVSSTKGIISMMGISEFCQCLHV